MTRHWTTADLEGPWQHRSFTITCSRIAHPDLKDRFWPLYEESFGPLRVRAAGRQVLTESEFAEEVADQRVWKYVAIDPDGELAGLTTLTSDLTTMPWISAEYYAHHYPEEWGRQAVFYVGFSLVRPDMRLSRVYPLTMKHVAHRVAAAHGVCGFDICGFNDVHRSLGRTTGRILRRVANFRVRAVDVQTYYAARIEDDRGGGAS